MMNRQSLARIIQNLDLGFDVMATMPIRRYLQGPAPVSRTVVRTHRALMMLAQNVIEYRKVAAGDVLPGRFIEFGMVG